MKEFPPQDTRTQFSERLKTALDDRSIPASPTLLRNHFNEHYEGKPISTQTASNWLSGVSIPNQDKLQVYGKTKDSFGNEVKKVKTRDGRMSWVAESIQEKYA